MGNSLSIASQRALIRAKLKPGSIIHIFCDFTKPPKDKFCVIVHTDYEEGLLLFFLVNSEIAKFIQNEKRLLICQLPLTRKNYPFFRKETSYLNCAEIRDDLDVEKVITHLINVPQDYKGILLDKDIIEVIQMVNSADTIGRYEKDLIINSLDN
ncbi:MAG TPA: hypothetical protein DIW44_13375 [Anaerolineaceae bacterium]|nr:hypothetical protein [Anaerolineaceae bacterium]